MMNHVPTENQFWNIFCFLLLWKDVPPAKEENSYEETDNAGETATIL